LIGALAGMGIPEYVATRYEGQVKAGSALISVHCETAGEVLRAREVLSSTGAVDIAAAEETGVSGGKSAASAPERRPVPPG
jgi:hypothetical protein